MSKKKLTIKEYARKLYLQRDKQGRKRHTDEKIVTILVTKGYKKVTRKTIGVWANSKEKHTQNTWNTLIAKAKQQSIIKSKDVKINKDKAKSISIEEQIIEKESDLLAEIYKYAEQGLKLGYREIFAILDKKGIPTTDVNIRDLITLVKMNVDIVFRINDIPEAAQKMNVLTASERDEKINNILKFANR